MNKRNSGGSGGASRSGGQRGGDGGERGRTAHSSGASAPRLNRRERDERGMGESRRRGQGGPPSGAGRREGGGGGGGSGGAPLRQRSGVLQFIEGGAAFLLAEGVGAGPDVFIPPGQTWTALPGDRALVEIRPGGRGGFRGGQERLEGRVVQVMDRAQTTVVGTVRRADGLLCLEVDDFRFPSLVVLGRRGGASVRPGEKAVVELDLDHWESPREPLHGTVLEMLGREDDPRVMIAAILRKYLLPGPFPEDVLAEAEAIPTTVPESDCEGRTDLRREFIFTIDPDTAKDFDDAINVSRRPDGGWDLGVHIADVSHYVKPGTALDHEALRRGNSTYLVDRVIPMLPERLSNGLCSLNPHLDRLTRSALFVLDSHAEVVEVKFVRAVIHSQARLTYGQALNLLENPDGGKISETLAVAWDLASRLRAKRMDNGSLDLDMPEGKIYLDAQGAPERIVRESGDISHQLIEEFMLMANDAVARAIKEANLPAVYRIHEKPDPSRLMEFRVQARAAGIQVGDLTERREMQKLLEAVKGLPEEAGLKVGLLRCLKRAIYSSAPLGHYGLAKTNYTHFTSPIRRYADLVVHRVLLQIMGLPPDKGPKLSAGRMAEMADHISTTERNSQEAERETFKVMQMEYFRMILERAPETEFDATVLDVRNTGVFIEIPEVLANGMVGASRIRGDDFGLDGVRRCFRGRRTNRVVASGSRVRVRLAEVNFLKRQLEFTIMPEKVDPHVKHEKPRDEEESDTSRPERPRRRPW